MTPTISDRPAVVMCFGDSNTWGHPPIESLDVSVRRYDRTQRWPGVMADALGDGFVVIEEGLNGRTTVFDDPVEGADRNGLTYLPACLESHKPLDVVVIMLGTNDLKGRFAASAFDVAWGAARLVEVARTGGYGREGSAPEIVLVAPPRLGPLSTFAELFVGGEAKSALLSERLRGFAATLDCGFMDAAQLVETSSVDGIHLGPEAHHLLGRALAEQVGAAVDDSVAG
ncbi:MAG: SGNH/GDSL hydrolase family protein [Acidimicrobiales bacterium]